MEHTFMMVLDHVGDQEAMVYAQLGQQPLVRTTATSLEPRRGICSNHCTNTPHHTRHKDLIDHTAYSISITENSEERDITGV